MTFNVIRVKFQYIRDLLKRTLATFSLAFFSGNSDILSENNDVKSVDSESTVEVQTESPLLHDMKPLYLSLMQDIDDIRFKRLGFEPLGDI